MRNLFILTILLLLVLVGCAKTPASINEETVAVAAAQDAAPQFATVTSESALKSAVSAATAGTTITISGTISLTSTLQLLNSGTSSSKINLTGGTLNCSGTGGWGVKCNGSYWNITNMTIENAPTCGLVFQSGGYNYVNNVTTTACGDDGILVYNGAHNDSINYCKSTNNYDSSTGGENADGFGCKLSGGASNQFNYCYAYYNSDDGWDLYGQPYTVTITHCTANSQGRGSAGDGNGFKLGSSGQKVAHTCTYCTANNNKGAGYDGNGNTGHITTTGSGGSGNTKALFTRIY